VSGGSIDQQITDIDEELIKFEIPMAMVEKQLVEQFAKMETMLKQL